MLCDGLLFTTGGLIYHTLKIDQGIFDVYILLNYHVKILDSFIYCEVKNLIHLFTVIKTLDSFIYCGVKTLIHLFTVIKKNLIHLFIVV